MQELISRLSRTIDEINELERKVEDIEKEIKESGKGHNLDSYATIGDKYRELLELKENLKNKYKLL